LKNYRDLTVLIQNVGQGAGSGVLIDSTHVLTCFHMARSPKDDFLVFTYPMGRVIEAKIEFIRPGDDLAILVLKEPVEMQSTPVFERHVEIGEPITAVGNALGVMTWFVSKGVVSGVRSEFILSDVNVNHGNSGGPWFNENGDIVAITDWMVVPKEGPGFAGGIPGAVVDDFLNEWAKAKDEALMRNLLGGMK
jgi:serine protease Do